MIYLPTASHATLVATKQPSSEMERATKPLLVADKGNTVAT